MSFSAKTSRILIALGSADAGDSALEIAGVLSAGAGAELLGLFVEDVRMLEHARSHLAREIMLSGRERALEPAALERQLRAQSRIARARFEAAAARLKLQCAFQVARGEIPAELIRRAADTEIMVLSLARDTVLRVWEADAIRQLAQTPLRALLFARERWKNGAPVLVVLEDPAGAAATLEAAGRFAGQTASPVTILFAGAAAAEHAQLLDAHGAALRERGVVLTAAMHAESLSAAATIGAARRTRAGLIVLPVRESSWGTDLVGELLRALGPSLLLLRGEQPRHALPAGRAAV